MTRSVTLGACGPNGCAVPQSTPTQPAVTMPPVEPIPAPKSKQTIADPFDADNGLTVIRTQGSEAAYTLVSFRR